MFQQHVPNKFKSKSIFIPTTAAANQIQITDPIDLSNSPIPIPPPNSLLPYPTLKIPIPKPPPILAMPPAPLTTLTAALALESSMEDEVAQITELILRSMDLTSLSASLSLSLTNLTTLSLSHNSFTSLNNFRNLKNLKDLNLNFNSLTSACVAELGELHFLKRLFLSNNQLDDEVRRN